jgi:hypothetical protein
LTATVVGALCTLAPAACGADGADGPSAGDETAGVTATTIAEIVRPAVGLVQPAGVVPVGTRVIDARFEIPAGGWGFNVVAVHAPQDPYATLYIISSAD